MQSLKAINTILILLLSINIYAQNPNTVTQIDKPLLVKKISFSSSAPTESEIEKAFAKHDIDFSEISTNNWPDRFPYSPNVKFRIAHSGEEIYIQFVVRELYPKAVFTQDEGAKPFKDSCVEFFMIPSDKDSIYYNLEMNCLGYGTFAGGAERTNRTRFGEDVLSKIRRYSSFDGQPVDIDDGKLHEWSLILAIPVEIYSLSEVAPLSGRCIRANFYKCGDETKVPHYLSWNPIGTERPNFHTPDYFGTICFE